MYLGGNDLPTILGSVNDLRIAVALKGLSELLALTLAITCLAWVPAVILFLLATLTLRKETAATIT